MLVKKIKGGIITFVGFLLSPLSWWNDLFVNIPLAYGFAVIVNFFIPHIFLPSMIVGYLGTNVLGLIMMRSGIQKTMGAETKNNRSELVKDVVISIGYTILIVVLYYTGVIGLPSQFLQ